MCYGCPTFENHRCNVLQKERVKKVSNSRKSSMFNVVVYVTKCRYIWPQCKVNLLNLDMVSTGTDDVNNMFYLSPIIGTYVGGLGHQPITNASSTTQSWNNQASGPPRGDVIVNPSPSQTAAPPGAGHDCGGTATPQGQHSDSSLGRHERHTTINQAKHLLHLEEGEFMVRAMYDFNPGTRDELPLKSGMSIVVADGA